jgi:hypothetical protein
MELPQNFTGYDSEKLSYQSFREFCFSLQSYGALQVIETFDNEYPKNYFLASVEDIEGKFCILQNCYVPVVAFATKQNEEFVFINKPKVKSAADSQNSKNELFSLAVLNENVQINHLKLLGNYERKAVQRWLPVTVGGVLFTWFFD